MSQIHYMEYTYRTYMDDFQGTHKIVQQRCLVTWVFDCTSFNTPSWLLLLFADAFVYILTLLKPYSLML